ncbi:MAG TPA: S8 family serine peptidase, partial [Candidatus Binatia bacterium]|nr:S8 family serine peptidase [Candidatus Binatia bacterium]
MASIELPAPSASRASAALAADPAVAFVELDRSRTIGAVPSDPRYPEQWSLPRIGWDAVHDGPAPSGHATVAVLDTGVDAAHADLRGVLLPGVSFVAGSPADTDPNGHGTWMAGIVAARTDDGIGIAGIGYAGVSVLPVTVLGSDGTGRDSDIVAGVVYAVDSGADVILMSFSASGSSAALQAAIDYAWSHDVIVVAATGNGGSSAPTYPAGDRSVIGVSSTDRSDRLAPGSNDGSDTFLAAPGVDILTTDAGGGYESVSGTSAAAAEVAGAAALLRALDPTASNGVIVGRLARDASRAGTTAETGNGRL